MSLYNFEVNNNRNNRLAIIMQFWLRVNQWFWQNNGSPLNFKVFNKKNEDSNEELIDWQLTQNAIKVDKINIQFISLSKFLVWVQFLKKMNQIFAVLALIGLTLTKINRVQAGFDKDQSIADYLNLRERVVAEESLYSFI